jgi:uncharacterized damage-inducible protein DinB
MTDHTIREHLRRMLDWGDAHATFDSAVDGMPESMRGIRPQGFPHSAWELVEHIRIAQADILDFCRNPEYSELDWPERYWPAGAAPPTQEAWDRSIAQCLQDRAALQALAIDPAIDLTAAIPHGDGQTYLRELLLVVDHTSYHVGQIIAVRRLLDVWGG